MENFKNINAKTLATLTRQLNAVEMDAVTCGEICHVFNSSINFSLNIGSLMSAIDYLSGIDISFKDAMNHELYWEGSGVTLQSILDGLEEDNDAYVFLMDAISPMNSRTLGFKDVKNPVLSDEKFTKWVGKSTVAEKEVVKWTRQLNKVEMDAVTCGEICHVFNSSANMPMNMGAVLRAFGKLSEDTRQFGEAINAELIPNAPVNAMKFINNLKKSVERFQFLMHAISPMNNDVVQFSNK